MAALKEERSYGLSCGRVGGRVSVFHVKLTDSALRAFESYQNCQDSISVKPAIRFQGSQGQITIPRPECPTEVRTFTFYLSNVGRDSPQGSFDCIQQYTQSNGNVTLDCLGCIQDKITVCATDDSYQKARQSMAQAEEENKSRGAIVIKMGSRYGVKKVQVRKPAPGISDAVPSRKRPTPVNIASAIKKNTTTSTTTVSQRPFKDRVIHLLALKPYKKPELILRLQKDGLSLQDKDCLDGLLQQVANISAKDCTYTLKDSNYKEVQKDWPGYSEGDQQLLKRILVRKVSQPQNPCGQTENAPLSPPKDDVNSTSPYPQKRPSQTPEPIDPSIPKKVRISHFTHRSQPTLNGKLNSSNGRDSPAPPTQPPTLESVISSSQIQQSHDPLLDSSTDTQQKDCESLDASERLGHAPQTDCSPVAKQNCNPTHGKPKKKSKKHKERDRTKEKNPEEKNCSSGKISDTLQDVMDLNGTCSNSSNPTSTSELPDYILKYTAIASQEQRQTYKTDFNEEYNEYRNLHARIERITSRFTQLDGQLKQLCSGSEEYKTIHDQILQEYRKIKKSNPNYSQEKNRCEYLHNKLAHIKKLIAQYDQQQVLSWH
ncbi:RNA polymerase II elongation factor ELL isoform X2 [Aquarana catesbeiana]|uniref:RNA polymerase II elongation factor ELL isoform X2 n=1 Tax=Aquarana catesbeiana TaxID=8400 RepID=UPI003CC94679